MSFGNYWVPKREKLVSDIENYSVKRGIERNFNVIIDATNFHPQTIKNFEELAKNLNAEFEIKKFEISLKKALRRDFWRGLFGEKRVGSTVIKRFFKQYINK